MPKTDFLAYSKVESLRPALLKEIARQAQQQDDSKELLQSHYHVAGSLEEHLGKINTAFRKWMKETEPNGFYYGYVLGIKSNQLVFYRNNWSDDTIEYYTVTFNDGTGGITFNDDMKQVTAAIVISDLELNPDSSDEDDLIDQSKKKMPNTPENKQDAVTTSTVVIDEALTDGDRLGTPTPPGSTAETDANTTSGAVPDPINTSLTDGGGLDKPTAGPGAKKETDPAALAKALADTEVGFKQALEIVGQPLQQTDSRGLPLIQSKSIDLVRQMSLGQITQAVKEKVGAKEHLVLTMIATRGDIINTQNQVYPTALWAKQMDPMNKVAQAGKFLGRVEHQEEKGLVNTAIRFTEFWMQGSDVCAKAIVIPTIPDGVNLQAMVEAGVQVDFSTVGYGTITQGKWAGKDVGIVQDDFVCVRVDAVQHGSSEGSTTTDINYQSKETQAPTTMSAPAAIVTKSPEVLQAEKLAAEGTFLQAKARLLDVAKPKLTTIGYNALQGALDKVEIGDLTALIQTHNVSFKVLEQTFAATPVDEATLLQSGTTYSPSFFRKQDKNETAPQTPGQMIDRLCDGLDDHWKYQSQNEAPIPRDANKGIHSPKAAVRQIMQNMARLVIPGFNGNAAIMSLVALENGCTDRAGDILTQSIGTGGVTTGGNADPGGAPLSTPMIFPLVRRVYPQYIVNEIAATQPMDRPDGKIFFLDARRVVDGTDANDPRMDINTSANPFSTSFSDNNTEGSNPASIRLELASIAVRAANKKLKAQWSIEEMQDLRAYHDLDASQELMGSLSKQMALEWNLSVLNLMLGGATANARAFGQNAPSGFTQPEWDAYFWNFISALDNDIFKKRNGQATHIVMGVDAALAASKSLKFVADVNSDQRALDLYPGVSFFPLMTTPSGSHYRIIKTNLWTGANANKVLVIRRGSDWSDTPFVFAPYADYVTPQFTNPGDFTQQQGLMSRAAQQVVVGDAMAVLTVQPGVVGTPL